VDTVILDVETVEVGCRIVHVTLNADISSLGYIEDHEASLSRRIYSVLSTRDILATPEFRRRCLWRALAHQTSKGALQLGPLADINTKFNNLSTSLSLYFISLSFPGRDKKRFTHISDLTHTLFRKFCPFPTPY
jgi:hypothetical protein